MQVVCGRMELKIYSGKADFNSSKLGSEKEVLFVEFPNCFSNKSGKPFKWMPTYEQLRQIASALNKIEQKSWREGDGS